MSDYATQSRAAASAAIAKGHSDPAVLRELLIWTTAKTTCAMVEEYFSHHLDDKQLPRNLVEIVLEGDDAGDAPWAAANTIVMFPPEMLFEHISALGDLSQHPWDYLNVPAKAALEKIARNAT